MSSISDGPSVMVTFAVRIVCQSHELLSGQLNFKTIITQRHYLINGFLYSIPDSSS